MSDQELTDFVVCGRYVGRGSGWDQGDTFAMAIYDFKSANPAILPDHESIWFSFESGLITVYDKDGEVARTWDIIETLGAFEKRAL